MSLSGKPQTSESMSTAEKLYLEIDHRMVGWCEKAVAETFTSLFGCSAQLRDVQIELNPLRGIDVSGVLAFGQSSLEGVLSVSFPEDTLSNLAMSIYKIPAPEIPEDKLYGAVSEITSIVFGLIKEQYNKNGYHYQASFPIVVTGSHHSIFSVFPTNKLHLSFDSQFGAFTVEISAAQGS